MSGRAAFVAAVALLSAGCGGSRNALGIASLGTTTPATTSGASSPKPSMTAFATCMTQHGVLTKSPGGHGVIMSAAPSALASAAMAACRKLMPAGGPPPLTPAQLAKRTQQLFVFARCMRSHGIPSFPDPDSTGEIPFDKLGAELGTQMRRLYPAYTACRGLFPHTGPQIRLGPAQ